MKRDKGGYVPSAFSGSGQISGPPPSSGSAVTRIDGDLHQRIKELERWVADLQSRMYVNCVYCGYRYGPASEVPVSMAEVLTKHIEQCPEHPLSAAHERIKKLEAENQILRESSIENFREVLAEMKPKEEQDE